MNRTSTEWANFWRSEVGVNVIPANTTTKKPLVSWSKDTRGNWQNVPIPIEVHNEWITKGMFKDGMAIICGEVFHNDEHKGKWLNAIDCDNIEGTTAMCPNGVDIAASKTLVEQHANYNKCHILSYTDTPLKNRAINPKNKELIEVKSMGKNILYCSGGKHKDGSMIDIVGTDKVGYSSDSNAIENKLDSILGAQKTLSSLDDIPLEEMGVGTNRGGSLIRELQKYFAHVPKSAITLEDYKMKAAFLNSKFPEGKSDSDVMAIAMSQYKVRMNDEPTYFELKDAEKEEECPIPTVPDTVVKQGYKKNVFRCAQHDETYDRVQIVDCKKDHPQHVYHIKKDGGLRSKIGEPIKLNNISSKHIHRTMESNVIVVGINNHIPYELKRTYECDNDCGKNPTYFVADEYRELGLPKDIGACECQNNINTLIHDKDMNIDADVQFIRIQQSTNDESSTPMSFEAILYAPNICKVQPGSEYTMTYIVRSIKDEKRVQKFSLEIVNMIIMENEKISPPTPELEEKISRIGIDNIIESVSPTIMFRYNEKFGILASMLSGTRKGTDRKELHTLLIGNAGVGKSVMLTDAMSLNKNGHTISAPSASKAGLLLGQQDNGSGKSELTIGPIIRANDSFITIDEFEKIAKIEGEGLHTPMTDGIATYTKNGHDDRFDCRVRIIAACNPIKSVWNPSKSLQDNTDLVDTMLSRFSLIFVLTTNSPEQDHEMNKSEGEVDMYGIDKFIEKRNMLNSIEMKTWIQDAQKYDPKWTEEANNVFLEQYRDMKGWEHENGDKTQASPLTNRARKDVKMICYSVARMNRSEYITSDHVRTAIDMFTKSLNSCGFATSKEMEAKDVKTTRLGDLD
jgi:DNA replicative helicase MCM subunit Mcm2 (Cdc46/Mcm family)